MFCSVCVCVCGLKEGSSQVLLHYFSVILLTGSGCRILLPQKRAANNEVWTAGCGVRPPRATGRTIPPAPPTALPCVFLGGHVSGQLCRSNLKYLVERGVVFWCFAQLPPLLSIALTVNYNSSSSSCLQFVFQESLRSATVTQKLQVAAVLLTFICQSAAILIVSSQWFSFQQKQMKEVIFSAAFMTWHEVVTTNP